MFVPSADWLKFICRPVDGETLILSDETQFVKSM